MKHPKAYVVLLLCMMLSFVSCGKEETEAVTTKPPEQTAENLENGTEDEWKQAGISRLFSENVISLKQGKVLENLEIVGEDSPYYCNLEENMRGGGYIEERRVLVCKDPVYDITYYVNYGRDYFIYALRDGMSELVLEIPASELYCKDGELYFMVEAYGLYEFSGIAQGNILKYNPVDGTVKMIIEEQVFDMVVYPDGICYETLELIEMYESGPAYYIYRFYFSFAEQETEEFDNSECLLERWREYSLVWEEEGGVYLANREGEKVRSLVNLEKLPYCYWIKDECMYYVKSDLLMRYHFETGEETVLAELGIDTFIVDDFIIQNDVVYFGNLLRVSLKDGAQYYAWIKDRSMGPGYDLNTFYSDGENLYCINSGQIWRMTEERIAENGYKAKRLEGRYVEYNCYEYRLEPLG